ncbi:MAG: hypothetical protein JXR68_04985 [Bacteroidales bacterium]|nr:hypothetical protein [Bacteroidales bacterium]
MEKIILINTNYVETSYLPEYKIAHIFWKSKIITSTIYREAISSLLDYSENNLVLYFLSDGSEGGAINPEDRKWFQDYVVKKADEKGLKKAAVVIKKDHPFKKYYMNAILRAVNRKVSFSMKIFYVYDEALNWIVKDDN